MVVSNVKTQGAVWVTGVKIKRLKPYNANGAGAGMVSSIKQ
jgi:hypothetical protein